MQNYTKTQENISVNSEVTCESLHVIGNVCEDSILETNQLRVDGDTQEGSTQYSRFAFINKHKGKLRCHEATIENLSGGEVHGTKVNIKSCEGGSVYAQEVYIETLTKPVTIVASHSITIGSLQSSHATLKISYRDVPIINSKIDLIQEDLETLKSDLLQAEKHNVAQLPNINQQIQKLNREYQEILNSYKIAKITINGIVAKENEIIFTLDGENEIKYMSQRRTYTPFHLQIDKNIISLHPTNITITL